MDNYQGDVWVTGLNLSNDRIFYKGEIIKKIDSNEDNNEQNDLYQIKLTDNNDEKLITAQLKDIQKANPSAFDGYDDMASLTYLNEPSVLNNLKLRYFDNKIYTYSGLFLVALNPYQNINIYNSDFIKMYSTNQQQSQNDSNNSNNSTSSSNIKLPPHIFGTAQKAFNNLINEKKDQSILVTGESGAGKTENTKKVIQHILSVSTNSNNKDNALILENQILQANPILESFGNATTVRNLNSSRFGKFIKIQINNSNNELSGAHIDWYLLEKSRVISQDKNERNYHVFYQLLKGASNEMLEKLLLNTNSSLNDFQYLKNGLTNSIETINDTQDFNNLMNAFKIMHFTDFDILNILQILSIILQLGNIKFSNSNNDTKQAVISDDSDLIIENVSKLLGVSSNDFRKSFLNSKIKVGRETVSQQRTASQAKFSIDALSKTLYEKLFEYLVNKINENFKNGTGNNNENENKDTSQNVFLDSPFNNDNYIGILDIAGFEIFEKNSFEQLCINYTNEKLQQFFNHHMFVLEQSEYMKEGISWQYIDFGNELKPTIELIEGTNIDKKKTNIFSILDEECIVPKGSDKSFIDKLFKELEVKDSKKMDQSKLIFKANKLRDGFVIKHYAGSVDYSVDGWLNKNKDPLSSTMIEVLSNSNNFLINEFFQSNDFNLSDSPIKGSPRKKTGMFRTVTYRHKEQLTQLMDNLSKTYPHFVRCILPNSEKKPNVFNDKVVLEQLRCNGVLEGIRIARSGYPNRIDFKTFASYYNILSDSFFNGSFQKFNNNNEYKQTCELILSGLDLDPEIYKIGLTKLFFRNGVLASLEKKREEKLGLIFTKFNAIARGKIIRNDFQIKLQRLRASKILIKNFKLYDENSLDPWFKLIKSLKPRLDDSNIVEIQYTSQIKKLQSQLRELQSKVDNDLTEHTATANKIESLEIEINQNREVINNKDVDLGESRKTIVKLEKQLAELSESSSRLQNVITEKDSQLDKLSSLNVDEVNNLKKENEELLSAKNKLNNKLESELKSVKLIKDELASLKSVIDSKEMEISSLKREKRARDTELSENLDELKNKVSKLSKENNEITKENKLKTESLNKVEAELNDLRSKYNTVKGELAENLVMVEDYESKKLAYDQSDKIKKKFKQLKYEFQQTKKLLDQKINDEIEFNEGRQQYIKELEETKLIISGLQKELEVEKKATIDLELKLEHAKHETERAIKEKKMLEIDNSQLKLRLRTNNPEQAYINQYEINEKKKQISPETHKLAEEVRLLRTRLASESYENRNLKAMIKKNGNYTDYLDKFKNSSTSSNNSPTIDNYSFDSNENVKIFNDVSEADELREKLAIEIESNKRLQDHYVKLQKDVMYYKGKNKGNDNGDLNPFNLLDADSLEYKNKFLMSEIEVNGLKEQIKDLRIKSKQNSNILSDNKNIINSNVNDENSVDQAPNIKLKHENFRLISALNEVKTKLNRLEKGNSGRFEQEEEIIQLKNNLKTVQVKNSALTSSVELYKDRSEDYYSKLSKAEVELQSLSRERTKFMDEINHLKEKVKRSQYKYEESDSQINRLNETIRDLEKNISDKNFEIAQLKEQYNSLKERFENSEELRKTVKSVNYEHQESEIKRLNAELMKSLNKETELGKMLKNQNLQLEISRKDITSVKFNNSELSKEKAKLTKALTDCIQKNEGLLGEVKENVFKVQNLSQQVNVLKVTNNDLIKERDDLFNSKRILESKLHDITIKFDEHLAKVRSDANNAVLVEQLTEKLSLSDANLANMNERMTEIQDKYAKLNEEFNEINSTHLKTVEENKELTKLNFELHEKIKSNNEKFKAELQAQDLHWNKRMNELDEKLFTSSSIQRNENYKIDNLTRMIKDLEIRNKDLERSKKHSDEEIKHLDQTIEKINSSYDSLAKREMEAQLRCKQLTKEIQKFREELTI